MKTIRLTSRVGLFALAVGIATPAIAGEIGGMVVDATETASLRAAELRIEELDRRATTERDGSYLFQDVPAGTYTVVAQYIGADPVSQTVTVPATGRVQSNFALGSETGSILVIGQAANQASALARKKNADGVSDVLTRDAIGQFPDQNVAESLRRLPGINVLNDQGEGRFVAVRGLDPNLNATSVNGVRIPSPESDIRAVALDVVSNEIIESIEVKKSLTPDMDADTIGASIEIETTSAFDRQDDLLVVKLGGSYNDLADQLTPDISGDFAVRLSDNFGITGGASFYNRQFETDNVEADDWQDDDGVPYAETVEYRDYDVERERFSATLGFDARLGETTELYLKGVYSRFDDQESRRRLIFDLGDSNVSASGTTATFDDIGAEATVERDVKDRFERQEIRTVVFGGESQFGNLRADYSLSWAKSSEREDNSLDPAVFAQDFEDSGFEVAFDYSDERIPQFNVTGNNADFVDPELYGLDEIELTALSDAEDEEFTGRFDLGYDIFTNGGTFSVEAGFKGRWREKRFNGEIEFYESDAYTLADVVGFPQTYRLADISPVPNYSGARGIFESQRENFELQEIDSLVDSNNEDFVVDEDILAGYLLGRWESDTLLAIAGVRYERTDNELAGNRVAVFEGGQTLPDGTVADDDTVLVTPQAFERDYEQWLPSFNLRFQPSDPLVLRLAGYRSLVRPTLELLAPRVEIDEDDEAVIGNPDLFPFKAWNLDASAEYYFSSNGAITLAAFYKDIEDYIVPLVIDTPGTLQGVDFEEAEYAINGESAEVFGVEVGFYQQLDFLPGLLSGFLVQANYTYTDASGEVIDGDVSDIANVTNFREIPLPATSKHTFNGVLGYEKGPVSLRLSGTYRDDYLDEVNADGPEFDRYVDSHFQLDFSARLRASENIQLYYEWVNINDAEYFAYNRLADRQNIYQYEEYSWTMKFGARVTF
ncbi:TonB-dependent receptor [Alteriqipengyuania lutimaris]|uniref:TonB-dependent receptor n=1 Tax=Alteriqipengyuania lutimaris TaxID=1538146 RepID=A0A395LKD5_9SPHN|nr:TonB-dependent receptor [Alteriqipengyuania lutimaris]MBB3033601.1 TonB-dependent receptor [Alteriqipengyuania lutimaris]RDS77402.1 TonB-dependent receptor [Alteriqipengyuania lutimaris]